MKTTNANGAGGKLGHVSFSDVPGAIVHKSVWQILPSPENEQLYRPVTPDDPEVIALADSIRERGVLEPLVITRDHYILSGHRRYAACQLAGVRQVPCRVEDVQREGNEDFVAVLREYNRQRVKSFDEAVREEIVSANPEEAYQALMDYRQKKSRVKAEPFQIVGKKRRSRISRAKGPFLDAIKAVLEDLRDFWPLTDRKIHYELLNDPPLIHASKPHSRYENIPKAYKSVCELLTRARLAGEIPWEAIGDETRPVVVWDCYRDSGTFLRGQIKEFLLGYARNLQQSQPNHIEIVGEKNTIENIVRPVAMEFCIPYTMGRGYSSIDPRHKMAVRFRKSGKKNLVLLTLADFDPEGEDIPHSFARSMRDDFGIENIIPIKVALTRAQVSEFRLPPKMKAKKEGSRYDVFVSRNGDDVFELEAIKARQLQSLLRTAVRSVLDVGLYNAEVTKEKEEWAHLSNLRKATLNAIKGAGLMTEE